jgi:hypothetical protein
MRVIHAVDLGRARVLSVNLLVSNSRLRDEHSSAISGNCPRRGLTRKDRYRNDGLPDSIQKFLRLEGLGQGRIRAERPGHSDISSSSTRRMRGIRKSLAGGSQCPLERLGEKSQGEWLFQEIVDSECLQRFQR